MTSMARPTKKVRPLRQFAEGTAFRVLRQEPAGPVRPDPELPHRPSGARRVR